MSHCGIGCGMSSAGEKGGTAKRKRLRRVKKWSGKPWIPRSLGPRTENVVVKLGMSVETVVGGLVM